MACLLLLIGCKPCSWTISERSMATHVPIRVVTFGRVNAAESALRMLAMPVATPTWESRCFLKKLDPDNKLTVLELKALLEDHAWLHGSTRRSGYPSDSSRRRRSQRMDGPRSSRSPRPPPPPPGPGPAEPPAPRRCRRAAVRTSSLAQVTATAGLDPHPRPHASLARAEDRRGRRRHRPGLGPAEPPARTVPTAGDSDWGAGSANAAMTATATARGRGGLPPHLSRCRRPRPAGGEGLPVGRLARPSHCPLRAKPRIPGHPPPWLGPRDVTHALHSVALAAGPRQDQAAQVGDSDRGRSRPGAHPLPPCGRQTTDAGSARSRGHR